MHTYSLPKWLKITLLITCVPMLGLFVAVLVAPVFTNELNRIYFFMGPLALVMVGFFTFALLQLNEQITIDDYSIKRGSRFINRELLLTDIAGYRNDKNYLILEPVPGRGKRIRITRYMGRFGEIDDWVTERYRNLDHEEAQAIFEDRTVGDSKEEIEKKIKRAKREIYSLNGLMITLIMVSLILPPLRPQAYYLLMVCPLPAIFLLYRHRALVKLGEETIGPTVSMDLPLMLSGGSMIIQALQINILRYDKIWPPAIAIAAILGALVIAARRGFFKKPVHYFTAGFMFIVFFAHGYAVMVFLNQMTDKNIPMPYKARIQKMWATHGKSDSYHLELAPWGPQRNVDDVTTSEDFYNSVQVNDTIAISLHPGGLDIPYLDVDYYLGNSPGN